MSDAAPPPPRGRLRAWLDRHPVAKYVATAALTAAVTAALTRLGVPPELIPPLPVPQSLAAAEEPIDYEGIAFHGDHEPHHLGEAEAARWPTDRITYSIDYASVSLLRPRPSDAAVRQAIRTGWDWWAEALDVEFVEVADPAQALIPIRFEPMDGPGGVLAEAYLADGTRRQKPMRFDSRENWTTALPSAADRNRISLPTVHCHEGGHSLGLGHDAATAMAVMRPTYTTAIPREQPRDVERMVALGYRRRAGPPPGGAGGTAQVLSFPVQAKASDLADALKKAGWKVEAPK